MKLLRLDDRAQAWESQSRLERTSMFAFYDLETTGTSAAFDQPLQFAAILTDDEFNQIERVPALLLRR